MAKEDDLEALPERVVKPLLVHIRQALRPLLCYSGAYQCLDQLILEDTKEEDSGINLLWCRISSINSSTAKWMVGIRSLVLFVISFTSLVLLFKAPYSYTAHVVPNTGLHRLGRSFWLLLLAEIFTSLGSYTQDVYGWLELNGWSVGEMQLQILLAGRPNKMGVE
eukprot:symbB.v1.2.021172.t1/scaffold1774.1/size102973/3